MTTPQAFPPTLREVLARPRSIGILVVCLIVAGVFAFLGQWQLGRAIDTDPPPAGMTENVRPLDEIVEPGAYLPEPYVGQRVQTSGSWVAGDFIVVSSRFNDGAEGFWVTGQLRVEPTASIAVALGWTDDRAAADRAVRTLDAAAGEPVEVTGRLISDEGVSVPPKDEVDRIDRMSPAVLLNRWHDADGIDVYRPYLASMTAPEGLSDIASPAPDEGSTVNWLNVFYAIEWAVFAGFAFYIWYRLAKDVWERELEDFEDAS